ncbi:hypothetical protein BDD12DRAFT_806557 [Trichophaea hybrida]|nr:hypothetical protein BDD12DRAFT_806557 [Trichophaea hybrida]
MTETAPQHKWGGQTWSASSPKVRTPQQDPQTAPAGMVARYTGRAPIDLSAGRRRMLDNQRAMRFADGRCLYCGGFNDRVVECAVRNKARSFKAAGAEVKDVDRKESSKDQGKQHVD